MNYTINLPIKEGDKIYTIDNCKIVEYFVEAIDWINFPKFGENANECIILKLEKYNDGVNFYHTERRLSQCFLTKEELKQQL
jgi:hypothetical protein